MQCSIPKKIHDKLTETLLDDVIDHIAKFFPPPEDEFDAYAAKLSTTPPSEMEGAILATHQKLSHRRSLIYRIMAQSFAEWSAELYPYAMDKTKAHYTKYRFLPSYGTYRFPMNLYPDEMKPQTVYKPSKKYMYHQFVTYLCQIDNEKITLGLDYKNDSGYDIAIYFYIMWNGGELDIEEEVKCDRTALKVASTNLYVSSKSNTIKTLKENQVDLDHLEKHFSYFIYDLQTMCTTLGPFLQTDKINRDAANKLAQKIAGMLMKKRQAIFQTVKSIVHPGKGGKKRM